MVKQLLDGKLYRKSNYKLPTVKLEILKVSVWSLVLVNIFINDFNKRMENLLIESSD